MTPDQMVAKFHELLNEYADSQVLPARSVGDTLRVDAVIMESFTVGTIVIDQDQDPLYKTADGWMGPLGCEFKTDEEAADYAIGPVRILNLPADDLR